MSQGLMNPREYDDLLKKLRHLRIQEQSAEKTLTEIRIEKATLIKENIDRVEQGKKMEVYSAAGVSQSGVSMDLSVKEMLDNYQTSDNLPGHSVLQVVAAKTVPEAVREKVLAAPDMTVKEVRELIKEAKGTPAPAPKRVDPYVMIERVSEMDFTGKQVLHGFLSSQMGGGDYAVLGLLPSADPVVVKAAIRALQNKHHPDRGGDAAEFDKIQKAAEAIQGD